MDMDKINKVNLFTEAREQAGMSIIDAAMMFGKVTEESKEKLTSLESVIYPYPIQPWAQKYLSELRRRGYEVQRDRRS